MTRFYVLWSVISIISTIYVKIVLGYVCVRYTGTNK